MLLAAGTQSDIPQGPSFMSLSAL